MDTNTRNIAMVALARMMAETPETPAQETEMLGEVVDAITEHVLAEWAKASQRQRPSHRLTHR